MTGFLDSALAAPENGGHTAMLLPAEAGIDADHAQ